jgi:hypothetical protein
MLTVYTGIRVLPRNFRNSSLFTATCKNSPSARCVSAPNCVHRHRYLFRKPVISLKQISAPVCGIYRSTCLSLSMFFQGIGFLSNVSFILLYVATLFLFCLFSILFLCICTVCVLYLCLCAGFVIGT